MTVERAGKPIAVVLSPEDYAKLTAQRKPRLAGTSKHTLSGEGVDAEQLLATPVPDAWWQAIVGAFKDDLAYEEAMRLGRQWRESHRLNDIPVSLDGT